MPTSGIWLIIMAIAILALWVGIFIAGLAVVRVVLRAILTFFLPFNNEDW